MWPWVLSLSLYHLYVRRCQGLLCKGCSLAGLCLTVLPSCHLPWRQFASTRLHSRCDTSLAYLSLLTTHSHAAAATAGGAEVGKKQSTWQFCLFTFPTIWSSMAYLSHEGVSSLSMMLFQSSATIAEPKPACCRVLWNMESNEDLMSKENRDIQQS